MRLGGIQSESIYGRLGGLQILQALLSPATTTIAPAVTPVTTAATPV